MTEQNDNLLAAELALGTLDPEDFRAASIRRLEDRNFAELVANWEERLTSLAAHGEVQPPPDMYDRIDAEITRSGANLPGTRTLRYDQGDWVTVSPCLRIKVLNRILSLNRQTIMVELAPGGEYSDHDHSQEEEIYMISGDLTIGELTLGPGDFHVASSLRHHPVHRTTKGCVCIISQAIDW